ncbi:MAG: hypothetical protein HZC22_07215 [Rhodocyclales bacterium]|nr:hypothetical protein [Rhodocyclales bacterium]
MTAKRGNAPSQGDESLIKVLDDLLDRDEDITARAVARLHPSIGHASTITRNPYRADLLAQYQAKQREVRSHIGRMAKRSKEKVAADLASKDIRIAELERQVDILRASHLAMIRAVGELGGMRIWLRFFEDHRSIRDELHKLQAMPDAVVTNMPPKR